MENKEQPIKVSYTCIYCPEITVLDIKDAIKCKGCGSGILLKKRDPTKVTQLFAV